MQLAIPLIGAIGGTYAGAAGSFLAGLSASGIGTALSLGGTLLSALSQRGYSNAQASIAANNAAIAQANAKQALISSQAKQDDRRRQLNRDISSIQAQSAGAGFETTTGTPLLLQVEQAMEGQVDIGRIGQQGQIEANNYTHQANNSTLEASSIRRQGRSNFMNTLVGGTIKAGSLLS